MDNLKQTSQFTVIETGERDQLEKALAEAIFAFDMARADEIKHRLESIHRKQPQRLSLVKSSSTE